MLIHHGFFYDFILDRTTADRTAELFFEDIVAIEKSLEHRIIPGRSEGEADLIIEDAPTLSITLPSGDQRTFTFANRAYLEAVMSELFRNRPIARVSDADVAEVEVDPLREAQLDANAALQSLRSLLREHKYLWRGDGEMPNGGTVINTLGTEGTPLAESEAGTA
jgi:hypothetical protein